MTNCIVIDDDPDIVAVFCDLLNMINLKVLATDKSGKNALKLYEEHKPDLVFTDLQMPGYDGIYVIESIKDKYPDAKIIIVTMKPLVLCGTLQVKRYQNTQVQQISKPKQAGV